MTAAFATPEWADAFGARLQESTDVRAHAEGWVYGPVAFAVDAAPEHGVAPTVLRLDIRAGSVGGVDVADRAAARPAPFEIAGTLARWRAVFGGASSIIDGVLESRLRVRGDLPTLARHRALLDAVAAAASQVETSWQDEQEPASASAG